MCTSQQINLICHTLKQTVRNYISKDYRKIFQVSGQLQKSKPVCKVCKVPVFVGDALAETGIQKWGSGAVAAIDEDDAENYVLDYITKIIYKQSEQH